MRSLITAVASATVASLLAANSASAAVVVIGNYTGGFNGTAGWATFLDLSASTPVVVTGINATTTANPGQSFTVQVWTRQGTALGGSLTAGPGGTSVGWTLLGTATGVRSNPPSPTSTLIDIPDITVGAEVTGVAFVFPDTGPRFNQIGQYNNYTNSADNFLTVRGGDVRSSPFTGTGTFTTLRAFAGALTYSVAPTIIPGDYNRDGYVDAADYTVWADTFGQTGTGINSDGNNDGVVDAADYTIWADNFGQGTPPSGVTGAVPEPTALAFAAPAVALLARRRRA